MFKIYSIRRLSLITAGSILTAGTMLNLTACSPGNNTAGATVAGAGAGALLGAAAFHGQGAWLGVLGGAVAGGIVGSQIGRYMDRQDEANMRSAISTTPQGDEASWTNKEKNITYTVTPVKSYRDEGSRYCREYQTTILVGGETKKAYGKACRMPDGQWKIEK